MVDVTASGDIYAMIPRATDVSIYKVTLGETYSSRIPAAVQRSADTSMTIVPAAYSANFKGYNASGNIADSRETVRSRAWNTINYAWTWHNTYNYSSSGTLRPSNSAPAQVASAAEGARMTGIPYSWGGWDDNTYFHSDGAQWTSFSNALTKYYPSNGPIVGNKTSAYSYLSTTAGIDCSGFVAAATEAYYSTMSKPGTGNIQNDGRAWTPVVPGTTATTAWAAWSGLQPMDVFVNSNHTFFYERRRIDGSGIDSLESTTDVVWYNDGRNDGYQGTKAFAHNWADLGTTSSPRYYWRSWWAQQPGDDFNRAITVSSSQYSRMLGYNMYFKYTVTTGYPYLRITANAVSGDPDIRVFDSSYAYLAGSSQSGADTVTVTNRPVGSVVYIQVPLWAASTFTVSATETY